jgi:hypothetical protein
VPLLEGRREKAFGKVETLPASAKQCSVASDGHCLAAADCVKQLILV